MNTLKSRTINKLALIALLFAVALPLVPKVYASAPFATSYTNASLTGVYGFSSQGYFFGSASPNSNTTNLPFNNDGLMWFDGNGTFKSFDTGDIAGTVVYHGTADNPFVGAYTVNPDGTGTMQWVVNGITHTRAFAIVDGGEELQFGSSDLYFTSRGVAKKQ